MADETTQQTSPDGVPGAVSLLQAARATAVSDMASAKTDRDQARKTASDRDAEMGELQGQIDVIDRALAILAPNS